MFLVRGRVQACNISYIYLHVSIYFQTGSSLFFLHSYTDKTFLNAFIMFKFVRNNRAIVVAKSI